jgi:hypothetical protein
MWEKFADCFEMPISTFKSTISNLKKFKKLLIRTDMRSALNVMLSNKLNSSSNNLQFQPFKPRVSPIRARCNLEQLMVNLLGPRK